MLEVGGGEGALTAELAPRVATVHVVELDDRMRPALERVAAAHGNVELHFDDAMRLDLAGSTRRRTGWSPTCPTRSRPR